MKNKILIAASCAMLVLLPAYAVPTPALKVEVSGLSGEMLTNVESRLSIERGNIEGSYTADNVRKFSDTSQKAVREAMSPYGYFNPTMRTRVKRDGRDWVVKYRVNQGKPVRVTSVEVNITGSGAQNKKILRTAKQFPLKKGDVFNSTIYSTARDKLFDVVSNEGYIKALSGESKVLVNTDTNKAVIKLVIDTKERYYFGKMTFNDTPYNDAFMQRFNRFRQDQPFSSNKTLQFQEDMNSSRYFRQVLVIPDLHHTKNFQVPMQVSVVPVRYRRYDFGIGYGTFTGPRLTAGMHFRRLTNDGQSLEALLKLSSVMSGLAVKYYIPGYDPLTEQWTIGTSYQKFLPKNGSSRSQTFTFGYSKKLHHWEFSANINYLLENYAIEDSPKRNSQVFYPNVTLNYMKADNTVNPTFGRSMSLSLQGGSDKFLSSTSFLQGDVSGKLLVSPFSFARVIVRGDIGYTIVHDLYELPLTLRYFAGGITSIRGFPDSSIGPGKYLGVASIEYRNYIAYDIYGAVFYDTGNATNHIGSPRNTGAGVGLVYQSVVGPIKIYAARAISKRGHPYAIEFSMGPEF
tara:strand:+ start:596 stop:2311 length:1716 start_codon:yes stop_codon:yes gene_type:complete